METKDKHSAYCVLYRRRSRRSVESLALEAFLVA